jgi:hypothetical protein
MRRREARTDIGIRLVCISGVQDVSRIPTRQEQNVCLLFRREVFSQTYSGRVSNRIKVCDSTKE